MQQAVDLTIAVVPHASLARKVRSIVIFANGLAMTAIVIRVDIL